MASFRAQISFSISPLYPIALQAVWMCIDFDSLARFAHVIDVVVRRRFPKVEEADVKIGSYSPSSKREP